MRKRRLRLRFFVIHGTLYAVGGDRDKKGKLVLPTIDKFVYAVSRGGRLCYVSRLSRKKKFSFSMKYEVHSSMNMNFKIHISYSGFLSQTGSIAYYCLLNRIEKALAIY